MPTIQVAKAFNLLSATNAKPQRFEVGPHDVSEEIAEHWYVKQHLAGAPAAAEMQPAADLDLATASRDALIAYLHAALDARIADLSDDMLREWAVWQKERGEEGFDDGADAKEPAPAPAMEAKSQDAGSAGEDVAARKAAIRDQLKAMGAQLPHHNASLEKHEAALQAAQDAAQKQAGGESREGGGETPKEEAPAETMPEPQADPAAGQPNAPTGADS